MREAGPDGEDEVAEATEAADVRVRPGREDLRSAVLAVSVLADLDVELTDDALVLGGTPEISLTWRQVQRAVGGADPDSRLARLRLERTLRAHRALRGIPPELLVDLARPVGFPVAAALHPGLDWVRRRVLGGALDLGLGILGLLGDPDRVDVVPEAALEGAEIDGDDLWPQARARLERVGELAARRVLADPGGVVRPVADCDVVTLLGAATLRAALCAGPVGMRAVAVPRRDRGWTDFRRIDPAFVVAAAAATDITLRGFPRPLLVTADEVVVVADGGSPAVIELLDAAPPERPRNDPRWS